VPGEVCEAESECRAEHRLFVPQSLAHDALLREFSRFFPRTFPGISPLTRSPSSRGAHLLDTPSHILPFILLAFPRHCPTSPPICSEALLIGSLRHCPLSFQSYFSGTRHIFPRCPVSATQAGKSLGQQGAGECLGRCAEHRLVLQSLARNALVFPRDFPRFFSLLHLYIFRSLVDRPKN